MRIHVERLFDIFEKDHYALLRLIYEIPELRSAARPLSFTNLISHTTQMGLQQHFTGVDRVTIARKSYVIDRCVLGMISRFLDEKPDFFSREEAIDEVSELVRQYLATLSGYDISATLPMDETGLSSRCTSPACPHQMSCRAGHTCSMRPFFASTHGRHPRRLGFSV